MCVYYGAFAGFSFDEIGTGLCSGYSVLLRCSKSSPVNVGKGGRKDVIFFAFLHKAVICSIAFCLFSLLKKQAVRCFGVDLISMSGSQIKIRNN